MRRIPERDWKRLRALKDTVLNRYCGQVLDEVNEVAADVSRSHHERYRAVMALLRERDEVIARCFDNLRRSNALWRLAAMHREGIVRDQELAAFSDQTREFVANFFD